MSRVYQVNQDVVANPTTVVIGRGFEVVEVHLEYFTDTNYDTAETPGAGTAVVTGKRQDDKVVTLSSLDCTDVETFVATVGDLKEVTVTPTGITVAGAYRVVVTVTDAG